MDAHQTVMDGDAVIVIYFKKYVMQTMSNHKDFGYGITHPECINSGTYICFYCTELEGCKLKGLDHDKLMDDYRDYIDNYVSWVPVK